MASWKANDGHLRAGDAEDALVAQAVGGDDAHARRQHHGQAVVQRRRELPAPQPRRRAPRGRGRRGGRARPAPQQPRPHARRLALQPRQPPRARHVRTEFLRNIAH